MITIRMPLAFGILMLAYIALSMVRDIFEIFSFITRKEEETMPEHKNNGLSRHTYRRVKNMDREQLSEYVTRVYLSGYEAGRKAATPELLFRTFREVLLSIDSIGPTRADAIMKKLGDTFAMKEKETAPEENSGAASEPEGTDEEAEA